MTLSGITPTTPTKNDKTTIAAGVVLLCGVAWLLYESLILYKGRGVGEQVENNEENCPQRGRGRVGTDGGNIILSPKFAVHPFA
jgi:hypothetical protein